MLKVEFFAKNLVGFLTDVRIERVLLIELLLDLFKPCLTVGVKDQIAHWLRSWLGHSSLGLSLRVPLRVPLELADRLA